MIAQATQEAMRVYLVAHMLVDAERTSEMLRMRGYDVRNGIDALRLRWKAQANDDPRLLQRTVTYMMVEAGLVVLAPDVCPSLTECTVGVCSLIGVPVVRYEDLPAMPPETRSKVLEYDMTRQ